MVLHEAKLHKKIETVHRMPVFLVNHVSFVEFGYKGRGAYWREVEVACVFVHQSLECVGVFLVHIIIYEGPPRVLGHFRKGTGVLRLLEEINILYWLLGQSILRGLRL